VVRPMVFAVPGDLATPTGGYTYDRRIIAELPSLGWAPQVVDLGDGFPRPTAATRASACARLGALPRTCPIVIDGLAFGVLPDLSQKLGASHQLVALVHHPLAFETGLGAADCASFRMSERAALAHVRRAIASSAAMGRLLATEYAVPIERLSIVPPGVDQREAAAVALKKPERAETSEIALLAVGTVVPRKGYDVLVAALARLKDLRWRLTIAGDCERSPNTAQSLRADMAELGLQDRITLCGAVGPDDLDQLYGSADVFVLASRFEGYGMAYVEAMVHGLPVVGTTAGAIPDTIPAGNGLLVPPDDVDALAAALRLLIEDSCERARLAARARAAHFPSWREQAALFVRALELVG
jgi:glycosyltransferase involved in cell wall biosynthesis